MRRILAILFVPFAVADKQGNVTRVERTIRDERSLIG
jgi:hypothetical protein